MFSQLKKKKKKFKSNNKILKLNYLKFKILLSRKMIIAKIINSNKVKMNPNKQMKITFSKKFQTRTKYWLIIQTSNMRKMNKILKKFQKSYKEGVNFQKNLTDGSKIRRILIHSNKKNNQLHILKGSNKSPKKTEVNKFKI